MNFAGLPSDAFSGDVAGEPDVHDRPTDTLAPSLSEKSFTTVNCAEFSVFVILQVPETWCSSSSSSPTVRFAWQVPAGDPSAA